MKKIPTLYLRDENRRFVTDEVTPGCEWVLVGEGKPTRKYDGTCVMLDRVGDWWARREVKPGKDLPPGYILVDVDETTGKLQGWEPMEQSSFAKFHSQAIMGDETPGTYELVGPKINGNPEQEATHTLYKHEFAEDLSYLNHMTPKELVRFINQMGGCEGVVWHHPDGRRAKLKARDLPQ